MRRFYIHSMILMAGLLFATITQTSDIYAQDYSYTDSWAEQGTNLISADNQSVRISVSIQNFQLKTQQVGAEKMNSVKVKDVLLQGEQGAPDLPVYSQYIAVPKGASVKIHMNRKRTESVQDISIAPAPQIPLDTDQGPLRYIINEKIYNANALYPSQIANISELKKIRGVDVVLLAISPFQYNPVTKELLIHRDINLEVEFVGGTGQFGENRLRNRWWDPIVKDMVLNDESIPDIDFTKQRNREETGCEYLIITPDNSTFLSWADSIKQFRNKQGILTKVLTTTDVGGNTTQAIEAYINDAYNNWEVPPVAVLLMADYGNSGNTVTSPIYNSYCISDNIYADVDNDHMPDIIFARMTAQDEGDLETMVNKFLNYERTPPTNPDFYEHPITAMGWQTERWFQLCSEIIAGFFENELGKSAVRENAIYSGNPGGGVWSTATNTNTIIDVFGEDGLGYIPDSPDYLDDWGGNASRVNAAINSGAFILQHRDHGGVNGWGEPAYSSADIDGLTNEDLTFVFSVNCLTGKFDEGGECFAEKFHRHEHGALGIIAATEVSYSFVNDTYVWGLYDNLWPDFLPQFETEPESRDVLPAFGNVAGKYFLEQSGWPYNTSNKEVTYYLFHHHGDAFSTVYYDIPQYLTVDYDEVLLSGIDYFTISVDEGAFICLSIDGEILATAEGTGVNQEIPIEPQDPGTILDIVITKQNYYRYENQIEVIPPDGPYCMYDDHILNDSCGNGNDRPEFNENMLVTLSMKNLGNEDANKVDVILSSTDNYITFIDAEEDYDTIRSGEYVNRDLAYKFHISDGIPDQHRVQIDITAKDENDSTWNSKFYMVVRAPKVEARDLIVDDSEFGNGNGRLDPGEKADIKIKMVNIGHCNIENVVCNLVAYNQFVNVDVEEQVIPVLSLFGAQYPTFSVTVSDDAPEAAIAQMNYYVTAAGYDITKVYFPKIGIFLEDFETGNFEKYNWVSGGDLPWGMTTQNTYEGNFSAQSGAIDNNQSSSFKISYRVMNDDNIKFYKRVSSELDKDKLYFYIDGQLRGSWSGTSGGWTQESFPIPAGLHTFKWEYKKDASGESGSDCAWVDYIELPTELFSTVFAGPDSESCLDGTFQCFGMASNYETVEWSSSGDGTFNNTDVLNPVYTPGDQDLSNGQVYLTLQNNDNEGESITDEMVLTFIDIPDNPEIPDGPDFVDVYKELETTYFTSSVFNATGYYWELSPAEAGNLFEFDTTAIITWNPEFLGEATLKVAAIGYCGESDFSEELQIFIDNTVNVFNLDDGCSITVAPNPNNGQFRLIVKTMKDQPFDIKIYNTIGTEIFAQNHVSGSEVFAKTFNAMYLPQGVYVIVIKQGNSYFNQKIIITR